MKNIVTAVALSFALLASNSSFAMGTLKAAQGVAKNCSGPGSTCEGKSKQEATNQGGKGVTSAGSKVK